MTITSYLLSSFRFHIPLLALTVSVPPPLLSSPHLTSSSLTSPHLSSRSHSSSGLTKHSRNNHKASPRQRRGSPRRPPPLRRWGYTRCFFLLEVRYPYLSPPLPLLFLSSISPLPLLFLSSSSPLRRWGMLVASSYWKLDILPPLFPLSLLSPFPLLSALFLSSLLSSSLIILICFFFCFFFSLLSFLY